MHNSFRWHHLEQHFSKNVWYRGMAQNTQFISRALMWNITFQKLMVQRHGKQHRWPNMNIQSVMHKTKRHTSKNLRILISENFK